MDMDSKPTYVEVTIIGEISLQAQGKEGLDMTSAIPILPFALREEEISERDLETLRKIAEDKNASAGRLRRTPKKVPAAEPVTTEG